MFTLNFNGISIALFVSAIISLLIAIYAFQSRHSPGAKAFMFMMLAVSIYSFGYGMEVSSLTQTGMTAWVKVEYLGIPFLSVLFLLFILNYSGFDRKINQFDQFLLLLVPFFCMLSNFTNEFHHLYYLSISIDATGPFPLLVIAKGPIYYINMAYSYLMILMSFAVWIKLWQNSAKYYIGQLLILLAAILIPLIANIVYQLDITPLHNIDLMAFSLTFSGLLMALGIFRYSLLDLRPIARNFLVDQLDQGIIVTDELDRILEINPKAQKFLGYPSEDIFGANLSALSQPWNKLSAIGGKAGTKDISMKPVLGIGRDLCFEVKRTTLYDNQGKIIGYLYMIQDITQLNFFEEEVSRQNEMILRFMAQKEGSIKYNMRRADLRDLLKDIYEAFKPIAFNKGLSLKIDLPDEPLAVDLDRDLIQQVLLNLVLNALKGTTSGEIRLSAKRNTDRSIEVCIADTGSGKAGPDLINLFKDIIEKHGGQIWVGSELDRGSTFSFRLPAMTSK